jgi:hypothetical protein
MGHDSGGGDRLRQGALKLRASFLAPLCRTDVFRSCRGVSSRPVTVMLSPVTPSSSLVRLFFDSRWLTRFFSLFSIFHFPKEKGSWDFVRCSSLFTSSFKMLTVSFPHFRSATSTFALFLLSPVVTALLTSLPLLTGQRALLPRLRIQRQGGTRSCCSRCCRPSSSSGGCCDGMSTLSRNRTLFSVDWVLLRAALEGRRTLEGAGKEVEGKSKRRAE